MFKNRYRIVTDFYCGYEAQIKYWWFPLIWFQMWEVGMTNTWPTAEAAEDFVKRKREQKSFSRIVVKEIQ